jgi:hypothetical protein
MDDQALLDELVRTAGGLGISVRTEWFETPAAGGGAACLLRGRPLVLLDERAPLRDRVTALARALAGHDVDAVFMLPEARAALEALTPGLRADGPRC